MMDIELGEDEEGDRISHDTLLKLREDADVRAALANPHLRMMLDEIDASENPEAELRAALPIAIFSEFADACLKVCGFER